MATTPASTTQSAGEAATVNMLVKGINAVLNALIDKLGVQAAETAGKAAAPPLGWPVVSYIFGLFVQALAASVDQVIVQWVDGLVIKAQQQAKNTAFKAARDEFQKVMDAQISTQAEKDAASLAMDAAFDKLITQHIAASN